MFYLALLGRDEGEVGVECYLGISSGKCLTMTDVRTGDVGRDLKVLHCHIMFHVFSEATHR